MYAADESTSFISGIQVTFELKQGMFPAENLVTYLARRAKIRREFGTVKLTRN